MHIKEKMDKKTQASKIHTYILSIVAYPKAIPISDGNSQVLGD